MELKEFLLETQNDVRAQLDDGQPIAETAFTEIVMKHMADINMTYEPQSAHLSRKFGNANVRLSGYSVWEEQNQLDLFVSLYEGVDIPTPVPDSETKIAVEQCLRFLMLCVEGKLAPKLDPSDEVRILAETLHALYDSLEEIKIYVLTDRVAKTTHFKAREIGGKTVHLQVMDIQRLHRHWSEGKPRDELFVDFNDVCGSPLPCVYVPGDTADYDYALTAIPGVALRQLYEQFGGQLLEANVRSFLSATGKSVNAGIQKTLRATPGRFMAYNNGIVLVVDELRLGKMEDGASGIAWLRGLQIVNGGQTTASLYFSKKKHPDIDLAKVRVPAKIIVTKSTDPATEEALVSDISRYANSQTAVKQSDLSANKPFHVAIERLSKSVYCPDAKSRWFYERAAGSYNTMLAKEGTSASKLAALKEEMPPARRISKTDLARYITAWQMQPDIVSKGSQKNFEEFMASLSNVDGSEPKEPDVATYKEMIAKAKVYRDTQKLLRPMFPAFQANVVAYTISLVAKQLGSHIDFGKIWMAQRGSVQLMQQIETWAREVHEMLHQSANGKMVSEWAKKPECRDAVLGASYSQPMSSIPEVAAAKGD